MIKIIESFVERNAETGVLTSYYVGQIVEGTEAWEALMISEGHAVNYSNIEPTGTISITDNGEHDVTSYATANVNVAGGSSDLTTATVTFYNTGDSMYWVWLPLVENNQVSVHKTPIYANGHYDAVIPLYKDKNTIWNFCYDNVDTSVTPVLTGAISAGYQYEYLVVKGNGTITLKAISVT